MGDSIPEPVTGFEIAIIGLSGRFPGAKDVDAFWRNLRGGVESISFFSDQEVEEAMGFKFPALTMPYYVKAGGVLDDIELFDASFFGYSPKEAEIMDPQYRLFMESAWEALESAGYVSEKYKGSIGVYAGIGGSGYFLFHLYPNQHLFKSAGEFLISIVNEKDHLPTTVSYKLNLKGPSVNIQTACSTSLVAVHMACQSLLSGECDIALAGGVSITVPQKAGYFYDQGGVNSPDGHCRTFDDRARGTVHGNGLGIVVLKRLADAISDGDAIHAVVKGSAINNDGSSKVGYTAPSIEGQAKVINAALSLAEVDPETITYIEAHGTGTALGDPIEIAALTRVFRASTDKRGFCAIGSVKTNIGHLDAAAGVAGLIKTVLALEHKQIPASLNYEEPNKKIDFEASPFYVNSRLREWETNGKPRRAGVSSFGIGGTNAHVILEEAPEREKSGETRSWQLLTLSARSEAALEKMTDNLVERLKQNPDLNLADAAFTLQVGRHAFNYRRTLVCRDIAGATSALDTRDPARVATLRQVSGRRPVVFMFSGQGSQYVNMGRELYEREQTFRERMNYCNELLKSQSGLDLLGALYPEEAGIEQAKWSLQRTSIAQPALYAFEYALASLWMEWGVKPSGMIGHSIGEYVAAALAGVFTLEAGLELVTKRGALMQSMPEGAMLSVGLPEARIGEWLGNELSLAAVNGPSLCVVSGPKEPVDELESRLRENGIIGRRLRTSHAFHSSMTEGMLQAYKPHLEGVELRPPAFRFISNVTGKLITDDEATDPVYWVRHARETVRFADGIASLSTEPDTAWLEIGPGRSLTMIVNTQKTADQIALSSTRHPDDTDPDEAVLLKTVGQLWLAGVEIDWTGFYAREERRRLRLPMYPFDRRRYWIERNPLSQNKKAPLPSLGRKPNLDDWFYRPIWKQSLPPEPCDREQLAERNCRWLIFADRMGLAFRMARRLEEQGQEVTMVEEGEEFARLTDGSFRINPRRQEDYDNLIKSVSADNKTPERILHLWNVTPSDPPESRLPLYEKNQSLGFFSLLFLAQALARHGVTQPLQIQVLSNNMQRVVAEEATAPEKSTLLGPCRVIPQEFSNIRCRSIDLLLPAQGSSQEAALVDLLIDEVASTSSDPIIAFRSGDRWVEGYEAMSIGANAKATSRLREGGVYLITGGLGGIGLELAGHLARTARAKLILTTRSAFPEETERDDWIATHNEQDNVSRKINKARELEKLGAEVLVIRADVADERRMGEAAALARSRFGVINGVIHAAGLAGGGLIQFKSPEAAAAVLDPKVKGTLVLEEVFKDARLDFLILFSSLTSLLGGFGQVDYCAANAFLDAFASRSAPAASAHTLTINWDTWREAGMAVNTSIPVELKEHREDLLKKAILSAEGVEVFSRILRSRLRRIIISTQELEAVIQESHSSASTAGLQQLGKAMPPRAAHPRPSLGVAYVAPRNEVERNLANHWQKLLGLEQVGVHDNFFELGGHSLLAIQLISGARDSFQVEIPVNWIFDSPTIADLSVAVIQAQARQVDDEVMAEILAELAQISDEEAGSALADRGGIS